jgi:hypothetical protein
VDIRDELFLNQVAQAVYPSQSGLDWFGKLPIERQRETLRWLANMALQAGARGEDAANAIRQSGLKPTYTPCVLLAKENLPVRAAEIANLPSSEFSKAYRLLMALFQVADARRRATQCANGCLHWWHRDLSDARVTREIEGAEVA